MSTRKISFSLRAAKELEDWQKNNHKVARKIMGLAIECARTPHEGTGKPEGLKGDYAGYWSRRITDGDRFVYRVNDEEVFIFSCSGHYDDK